MNFEKNNQRELSTADHRLLGQQLDLYSISDEVGSGLVLWHPKGTTVRNIIRDFWEKEHIKNGYELVCTPHIAREELWRVSGHLDYYKENMYLLEKDGEKYVVKPMNCPLHIQIYKSRPRSYRDLPIRYAEWGTVYRYERSGTLQGLLRARGFTQDDAHIFCSPRQAKKEILQTLNLTERILQKFGFHELRAKLSTKDPQHPEEYMGTDLEWQHAQNALAQALEQKKLAYQKMPGEAVFYGPKIDISTLDAQNKEWQCTTIQFDFNLPKRFNIVYTGPDGNEHQAIMIHRAILGAIERFFAVLLEQREGNLPTWLAPTQAIVLPITANCVSYARKVHRRLLAHGIRSEIDTDPSTTSYKIRQAELHKIPYMAICGEQETKSKTVSVRKHKIGNIGSMSIPQLINEVKQKEPLN